MTVTSISYIGEAKFFLRFIGWFDDRSRKVLPGCKKEGPRIRTLMSHDRFLNHLIDCSIRASEDLLVHHFVDTFFFETSSM